MHYFNFPVSIGLRKLVLFCKNPLKTHKNMGPQTKCKLVKPNVCWEASLYKQKFNLRKHFRLTEWGLIPCGVLQADIINMAAIHIIA